MIIKSWFQWSALAWFATGGLLAAGMATPADARAVKSQARETALVKLTARDRLARIALGRSLAHDEMKDMLPSSDEKYRRQLLLNDDLNRSMNNRIHHFLAGSIQYTDKDPGFGGSKRAFGKAVLGDPNEKLNAVIGKRIKDHHQGRTCAPYNTATRCFAAWLVNRVAPELGPEWVEKQGARLDDASYHRLIYLIMEAVPLPAY